MIILAAGVALWAAIHLLPSLGAPLKAQVGKRLGERGYRLGFSLVVALAVALMVIGWRMSVPVAVYTPPSWGAALSLPLMALALVLFTSARRPTALKRHLRHPQLLGVLTWAISHLLANGDSRSLLLFGGMGLWALVAMPAINAREGPWKKPEPPPLAVEIKGLAITALVFVALILLHPYFAGVPALALPALTF